MMALACAKARTTEEPDAGKPRIARPEIPWRIRGRLQACRVSRPDPHRGKPPENPAHQGLGDGHTADAARANGLGTQSHPARQLRS
jgi:hypothetical protein